MKAILFVAAMCFASMTVRAQEKVMNVQKADGTTSQMRVADINKISFLVADAENSGLLLKMTGGEVVSVLFESNPVVTLGSGKLTITSDADESKQFEIGDIAEITFGDASGATSIARTEGFSCVVQGDGIVLRGLPKGAKVQVCSLDGRVLPVPESSSDELRLSRQTLGSGVFIVKAGSFSAKIKL